MKEIDNLTGVVIEYATPDLLKTAIDSIRKFYDFPIIIINGSNEKLDYPNVVDVGYNIGHGLGMDMGIKMAKTDYVLTFDTDIEMKEPCLELMLEKVKEDTYAVGKLYLVNNSYFYARNRNIFPEGGLAYVIHPSFQIVNKKEYLKYAPYISDGAPTVLSYHDIMRHKKEKEILVDFPVLDYIYHRNAGTRDRITEEEWEYKDKGNPHWLKKWVEYIGVNPI
jgi:GT2 family glycosyltransferase